METIDFKTKLYFGKDSLSGLEEVFKAHKIKKVMLTYGGGSIKKNGIYDQVINILKKAKITTIEFSGIQPNPREDHVYLGAKTAAKNKVDAILSVGGGSATDAAKVMGILATNPQYKDCWSYVQNQSLVTKPALPIIAVVTLAGTASENNAGSVITNQKTLEKRGVFTPSATPIAAILNPEYTYTVNPWQTASGIFDCFSHLLEQFFGGKTFEWTKQYIFANLRTLIKYAPIVVKNPRNYEARANVLFTTTMALNDLASFENQTDWSVHRIEHAISAIWDVTHGAGLALVTPTYIKHRALVDSAFAKELLEIGDAVFGTKTVDALIKKLKAFIKIINLPAKFSDFAEIKKITDDDRKKIYKHVASGDPIPPKHLALLQKVINLIPA
ncbi:iron-containing alcohol dehydrogenase [[Mycoplasma] testudinis]|uniref:iron-containing alcohol dehydrogenase n=1 Tax=[Mycoplasma] testudinis TaxID=33924 RepID=UPI000481A3F6|nr:iron-containing alcohol dehydrogenase [[Mycoplasma] testudinis]